MPEGPEVLITSQYLKRKLKGRFITSVKVLGGRYTHQTLVGKDLLEEKTKIIDVNSKGKFLWMELKEVKSGETIYLLNTFGMSGRWDFGKTNHSRILFRVKNSAGKNYKLYFHDQRNFGTVLITKDRAVLDKKLNQLSVDLIKSGFTEKQMIEHIKGFIETKKKSRSNKNIVCALMNQDQGKAIGSGIGNYLCAEILYAAKLSPHRNITTLTPKEVKALAKAIRTTMKHAYVNNSTNYLTHMSKFMEKHYKLIREKKLPNYYPDIKLKNKEFTFKVYSQDKDPKGNKVSKANIFQKRTTWWVKEVQK